MMFTKIKTSNSSLTLKLPTYTELLVTSTSTSKSNHKALVNDVRAAGSVRPFVQSKCQIGGTPTHEKEKLSINLLHRPSLIGTRSMQSTVSTVVNAQRYASPMQLCSKPNL